MALWTAPQGKQSLPQGKQSVPQWQGQTPQARRLEALRGRWG